MTKRAILILFHAVVLVFPSMAELSRAEKRLASSARNGFERAMSERSRL